jgi:hypothetical protein
MENGQTYRADSRWTLPFAPTTVDPVCYGSTQVRVRPTELISGETSAGEFTFDLPTISQEYINLQSAHLLVRGLVKRADDSNIDGADDVAIGNNFLHTLFKKVEVCVGQNQTKITTGDYSYIALLQTLDKIEAEDRSLDMQAFIPDNGSTTGSGSTLQDKNYLVRKTLASNSNVLTFMGKPFVDILNLKSFWPKNTPISITFYKNSPEFYLQKKSANNKHYKFAIQNIELHMDSLKIDPALSQSLGRQIELTPAQYSYEHLTCKKFQVASGNYSITISKLWNGVLPRRFCVGLIPQNAYKGDYIKDPLKFTRAGLSSLKFKINTQEFLSISGKDKEMLSYYRFLQFLQVAKKCCAGQTAYNHSLPLFCVDMNIMCQRNESCINEVSMSGVLSLEIEYESPPPDPHLLLFYAYTSDYLTINSKQEVTVKQSIG